MTFRILFLSVSKALMNPQRGLSRKQSWGTARGKLHAFQPKFPLKQLSAVLTHPEPEPLWASHLSEEKISGAKWHFSMLIHWARGREDGLGIDGQTIYSRKLARCRNLLRHFPPNTHTCALSNGLSRPQGWEVLFPGAFFPSRFPVIWSLQHTRYD